MIFRMQNSVLFHTSICSAVVIHMLFASVFEQVCAAFVQLIEVHPSILEVGILLNLVWCIFFLIFHFHCLTHFHLIMP